MQLELLNSQLSDCAAFSRLYWFVLSMFEIVLAITWWCSIPWNFMPARGGELQRRFGPATWTLCFWGFWCSCGLPVCVRWLSFSWTCVGTIVWVRCAVFREMAGCGCCFPCLLGWGLVFIWRVFWPYFFYFYNILASSKIKTNEYLSID